MSLDAWKKKRTPFKAKLTRFRNKFAAYNKALGLGTWPIQLGEIEPLYEEFDKVQTEIDMAIETADEAQETCELIEFERAYFETVSQVREFIEQIHQGNSSTSGNCTDSPTVSEPLSQASSLAELANLLSANSLASNLPTIRIPTFDRFFKDWVKFRDLYKTMVHDKVGLTNVQKFHYLSNALT